VPVVVRRARPEEAGELTRIAHAAKRHWRYPEEWIAAWRADLTVAPERCASEPVWCACSGERVLGFYVLSLDEPGEASLEHMWVDPPNMGAGVGATLFRHAVATATELGACTLEIASDPNAEGFYLRMGAKRAGEVPSLPAGRTLPVLVVALRRA
jgi:GNAT superfamily N-acetyltransferase